MKLCEVKIEIIVNGQSVVWSVNLTRQNSLGIVLKKEVLKPIVSYMIKFHKVFSLLLCPFINRIK